MSAELKQLLTIDDVCSFVKVSPNTVRSWLAADTIPSLRAGQLVRFDPDELDRWLRKVDPRVDVGLTDLQPRPEPGRQGVDAGQPDAPGTTEPWVDDRGGGLGGQAGEPSRTGRGGAR